MKVHKLIHKKPDEQIIFVLRRHPATFIPMLLLIILLLLVPVGLFILAQSVFPALFIHDIILPILVLSSSIYILSIYLFAFAQFIDFYLDLWIVTNERIVDVEQFNLFSRTVSELDLFRIQDVTTDVHGIFATLFDYGNVTVKTASQNVNIVFKNVSNPNDVRQTLVSLCEVERTKHTHEEIQTVEQPQS